MKILLPFLLVLAGCSATVSNKRVSTVPPDKVTRTVTETVKTEHPVPVYQTVTDITSTTKTIGGADLHRVEIKSLDQPAAK